MREKQEAEGMQKEYLRDLLKKQPYVALAYMTGILPVKKYGSSLCAEYVLGIFHDRSERTKAHWNWE